MGQSVTQRDRVWAAAVDRIRGGGFTFTVEQVHRDLKLEDRSTAPSRETVRRTLVAMSELGVLDHKSGSMYWKDARDSR